MIYVIAEDEQGNAIVVGPFKGRLADETYLEIESWGWTIRSSFAHKFTLAEARREVRKQVTT